MLVCLLFWVVLLAQMLLHVFLHSSSDIDVWMLILDVHG